VSRNPDALPTAAFDYPLPADLVARHPAARRDASRMLVLDRATGSIEHRVFSQLPGFIAPGDALVLNETRVFPARLLGRKTTGAAAEVLLLRPFHSVATAAAPAPLRDAHDPAAAREQAPAAVGDDTWEALVRPGAKLRAGARIDIADDMRVEILEQLPDGRRVVRIVAPDVAAAIARHGRVPLPPYIDREATAEDSERYQTVYARVTGSVAAPTAGLHFTPDLLHALETAGVRIVRLTLHVGPATFRPVDVEDPAAHTMHAEPFALSTAAAARINEARQNRRRVWAVGTTVVRTLETLADANGNVHAGEGETAIFIRPPWTFRAVDHLITNFHLPRSTLLMLVSAFAGHALTMAAYAEAVRARYRFYSYGDCMVVI